VQLLRPFYTQHTNLSQCQCETVLNMSNEADHRKPIARKKNTDRWVLCWADATPGSEARWPRRKQRGPSSDSTVLWRLEDLSPVARTYESRPPAKRTYKHYTNNSNNTRTIFIAQSYTAKSYARVKSENSLFIEWQTKNAEHTIVRN